MVVEGVLDGGEDGVIFVARCGERGSGIDADVDIGGSEWESEGEKQAGEREAIHGMSVLPG